MRSLSSWMSRDRNEFGSRESVVLVVRKQVPPTFSLIHWSFLPWIGYCDEEEQEPPEPDAAPPPPSRYCPFRLTVAIFWAMLWRSSFSVWPGFVNCVFGVCGTVFPHVCRTNPTRLSSLQRGTLLTPIISTFRPKKKKRLKSPNGEEIYVFSICLPENYKTKLCHSCQSVVDFV